MGNGSVAGAATAAFRARLGPASGARGCLGWFAQTSGQAGTAGTAGVLYVTDDQSTLRQKAAGVTRPVIGVGA